MVSGVATSTSSFVVFCGKTWYLQPSGMVVKDGKPMLRGVSPQPIFDRRLLDLVIRGEWLLRSSKPCMVMSFAGVPIHYLVQCSFQFLEDEEQAKEEGHQYVFICYWLLCVLLSALFDFPS
jgi:hypothetical protein